MTKKIFPLLLFLMGMAQGAMAQEPEAYAVLSDDGQTVTFYYDTQCEARNGSTYLNGGYSYYSATTAIFDASFANYRPTSTSFWFNACSQLTSIIGIENLNTADVTDMWYMFADCRSLTSLDVSHFDTRNVTNMSGLFVLCTSLKSLDLSNFDTGNVTDMSGMFMNCSSLTSLDLSNFDTGNVTNMYRMFYYCSGLTTIYCNDTWHCDDASETFSGCSNLSGYDEEHTDANYAKPIADGGYFTPKTETASKVDDAYWRTYYTDVRNVKADENTTVYTAVLSADGTTVELNEVADKIVPRGQAVILKSTAEPMLYTYTDEYTGTFPANDLRGTQRGMATADVEGTVYTLAAENDELAFYRYTGQTLDARKAFLVLENGANVRCISFAGNEETGISDVNGQTVADGAAYDLQGRRIAEPQKGLYIVNGKKMVKR